MTTYEFHIYNKISFIQFPVLIKARSIKEAYEKLNKRFPPTIYAHN